MTTSRRTRVHEIEAERQVAQDNVRKLGDHLARNQGLLDAHHADWAELSPQHDQAQREFFAALRKEQAEAPFSPDSGGYGRVDMWDSLHPRVPGVAQPAAARRDRLAEDMHGHQVAVSALESANAAWRRRLETEQRRLAELDAEAAAIQAELSLEREERERVQAQERELAEHRDLRARLLAKLATRS